MEDRRALRAPWFRGFSSIAGFLQVIGAIHHWSLRTDVSKSPEALGRSWGLFRYHEESRRRKRPPAPPKVSHTRASGDVPPQRLAPLADLRSRPSCGRPWIPFPLSGVQSLHDFLFNVLAKGNETAQQIMCFPARDKSSNRANNFVQIGTSQR
jgi:hypothetical protein